MRTTATVLLMSLMATICHTYDRTEAQRYYDLGLSYIKSDLYEDGLKTLNQVAFLSPDSDVADDALYQLALIREQVGDGKIVIGEKRRLETVQEELDRLQARGGPTTGFLGTFVRVAIAHGKGEAVFEEAKELALTQYVLALDYLNTLSARYPESDRLEESNLTFNGVVGKIEMLIREPGPPEPQLQGLASAKAGWVIVTIVAFGVSAFIINSFLHGFF